MGKRGRVEDTRDHAQISGPQAGTAVKIAVDLARSKWVSGVRWQGAERLKPSTSDDRSGALTGRRSRTANGRRFRMPGAPAGVSRRCRRGSRVGSSCGAARICPGRPRCSGTRLSAGRRRDSGCRRGSRRAGPGAGRGLAGRFPGLRSRARRGQSAFPARHGRVRHRGSPGKRPPGSRPVLVRRALRSYIAGTASLPPFS